MIIIFTYHISVKITWDSLDIDKLSGFELDRKPVSVLKINDVDGAETPGLDKPELEI